MCARQAGKSQGADGMLLDNALNRPGSLSVLLGLNGVAVRTNNWEAIWQPLLNRYNVAHQSNQQRMMTTFANGSRVLFAGTDDITHVRNVLGNRFHDGLFILDESQDQSSAMIRYLLTNVLPPTMTPTTRVVLCGVFPEVPAGEFWRLKTEGKWSRHSWGRFANVHTPEAREQLASYLRDSGISIEDPQIQRDWFAQPVFDKSAPAYRYDAVRNGYTAEEPAWLSTLPEYLAELRSKLESSEERAIDEEVCRNIIGVKAAVPFEGVRWFSGAIDTGGQDRCSVQVFGWGSEHQVAQHVFDWSSERGAFLPWSAMMAVAGFAEKHLGVGRWRYDTNSKQEINTVRRDYGINAIQAAMKADFDGQIRKVNDLLTFGRAKIMVGSSLEEDYIRARFSDKYRSGGGGNPWSALWHPDPSEAARYALFDYFDSYRPPVEAAKQLTPYEQFQKQEAEKMQKQRMIGSMSRLERNGGAFGGRQ